LALSVLSALGCGDDDDDDTIQPGDGDADADADGDAFWTIETIDPDNAANQTSLAVSPSGQVGIAYYTITNYTDGSMCPEGDPPGPQFHWKLRFASGTPGAMLVEEVDSPFFVVQTRGVTLRYEGETPNLVAMSGDIEPTRLEYCGANDLFLFSKNGGAWGRQLVVANSGEAPATDECVAASASTYGWVVGVHPALAIDAGGQYAIAWRDIHAGATLQRDDLARSDLELALGGAGGGYAMESIDCGGAAGEYTTLAWEPSGGLVASWYTEIRAGAGEQAREGIWVARRATPMWEKHRLFQGASGPRMAMAVAPDGTIGVVWAQAQALKYAFVPAGRPLAEAQVETASPVDINSGGHASLAYTADSLPVVSHYRCNRYLPDDPGCSAVEDGPVWSWREVNGATGIWKTEDIEPENNEWLCGDNTAIGVRPDGGIVIAYTCQIRNEDGTFEFTLKMASRSGI
jgi:hypothetical protein